MKKTIINVVGKDNVGIIAGVCTYFADNNINILDISQTIIDGYFNMIMIVDRQKCSKDFIDVAEELSEVGKGLGVEIHSQKEEIFNKMHRI